MEYNTYTLYFFVEKDYIRWVQLPLSIPIESYSLNLEHLVLRLQKHIRTFRGKKSDFLTLTKAFREIYLLL